MPSLLLGSWFTSQAGPRWQTRANGSAFHDRSVDGLRDGTRNPRLRERLAHTDSGVMLVPTQTRVGSPELMRVQRISVLDMHFR